MSHTELELRFQVPARHRAHLLDELTRYPWTLERATLAASYLDTPGGLLASRGLSWRLRREGRRWVQTLKQTTGPSTVARLEHEVIRPGPQPDPEAHAESIMGDRLLELLRHARREGQEPQVRYGTECRRTSRRVRSGRTVVVISYDEGRLRAGDHTSRISEVEFEWISGPVAGLFQLARAWQRRHGLVIECRSKSERGMGLATGRARQAIRKARVPRPRRQAPSREVFAAAFDECYDQILRNAIGLVEGDADAKAEHVHQLRVGIRRLRSALTTFRPWIGDAPPALVRGLRNFFGTLGESRDADVMDSGVMRELEAAGAPAISASPSSSSPDPVACVRSSETQQLLLDWLAWRSELSDMTASPLPAASGPTATTPANENGVAGQPTAQAAGSARPVTEWQDPVATPAFDSAAARRLRRWHRRIADAIRDFESLDDDALHDLRKRIKRQRYAVEFLGSTLRRRRTRRYLTKLAKTQERMGHLNDLIVARTHYEAMTDREPGAWFALGWLSARINETRARSLPDLRALATCPPLKPRSPLRGGAAAHRRAKAAAANGQPAATARKTEAANALNAVRDPGASRAVPPWPAAGVARSVRQP